MGLSVCDTKTLYDTEFEAEIAAVKESHRRGIDFTYYQCGTHWHLTHRDYTQRRGVGKRYWRCPKCKEIVKKSNAWKHKCDITK